MLAGPAAAVRAEAAARDHLLHLLGLIDLKKKLLLGLKLLLKGSLLFCRKLQRHLVILFDVTVDEVLVEPPQQLKVGELDEQESSSLLQQQVAESLYAEQCWVIVLNESVTTSYMSGTVIHIRSY